MKFVAIWFALFLLTHQVVYGQQKIPKGAIIDKQERKVGVTYEMVVGDDGVERWVEVIPPDPNSEMGRLMATQLLRFQMNNQNSAPRRVLDRFQDGTMFEAAEIELSEKQIDELRKVKRDFDRESKGKRGPELLNLRMKFGAMVNDLLLEEQKSAVSPLISSPFRAVDNENSIAGLELTERQRAQIKARRIEVNQRIAKAISDHERALQEIRAELTSIFDETLNDTQKKAIERILIHDIDEWVLKSELRYLHEATKPTLFPKKSTSKGNQ